jgi:hypothetical protein
VTKIYDNLDFTHAFEAFVNTMGGVSIDALHKGFLSVGVKDNEALIFSELMDAKSLFLTANAVPSISWASSTFPRGPWCSAATQGAWHHRRLLVQLGHRISARLGLIAARAGNTSSCRPATKVGFLATVGDYVRFHCDQPESPSHARIRRWHDRPAATATNATVCIIHRASQLSHSQAC